MQTKLSIRINGNCREAVEYYAKVFKTDVLGMKTYGDFPLDPGNPPSESDRDKVCFGDLQIGDVYYSFSEKLSSEPPRDAGNNIMFLTIIEGIEEATRVFNDLKEGGEVLRELQEMTMPKL